MACPEMITDDYQRFCAVPVHAQPKAQALKPKNHSKFQRKITFIQHFKSFAKFTPSFAKTMPTLSPHKQERKKYKMGHFEPYGSF
jgi:hypothetical protein